MLRRILMGLIFLMALKGVKLDIILNKFKSELGNWSESIPKIWLSYIRMHLFKHLERYVEICQSVNNIVWHILSRTKLLLVMNNDTTVVNECQDIRNMTNYLKSIVNLKCPVGQFVSYPKKSCYYDTLVHWQLNARLHLNMTFLTTDFSFCWSNCPLKVYSHLVYLAIVNGLSSRCNHISKYTHKFCGQYSSFSFFSKDNHVKMCNGDHGQIGSEYKVVGMFMIIDSNQLFNEPILKMKVKPQLVYNIRNKYKIFRFFITVNILNKIFLAMNYSKMDRYVVFDGPGLLSNTICLTSVIHAKCGIHSTLCWKIPNISGSTELFAL